MIRRAVVLLTLLTLLACGKEVTPSAESEARPAQQPQYDDDRGNLLNIAFGASVVWRSAELNLDASAVHAIDGITATRWVSPPGGPEQTLVFALAAPTRITQLGVVVAENAPKEMPRRVHFAVSPDGQQWREVLAFEPRAIAGAQLASVTPVTARFLRVDTESPGAYYSALTSVHVLGEEQEGRQPHSATGCWKINNAPAQLVQQGARVIGVIHTDPPTFIDGGSDGRVIRAMWLRGPVFGYAAITLAPNAATLSGVTFYDEPSVKTEGEAWLGERCTDALQPMAAPVGALFTRAKRWELYGLAFDDHDRLDASASRSALDAAAGLIARAPSQRLRIVAHELRSATTEQNRRHSVARIEAVRAALQARGVVFAGGKGGIELVAAGSDWRGPAITSAVQRVLASGVTIESVH